ncbi:hypothetical protein CRENPOLYSF1_220032 [Crenothrix polyspora]|uniref:Uncharacterized protein n=1 Tax=Crenothrix polyspora TaxID=360316 RepID=A0A1R4H6Q8_9GAMM|nr:hypothetical protein CRENPOLYSF1_220032 [Crenothrix polyspora]
MVHKGVINVREFIERISVIRNAPNVGYCMTAEYAAAIPPYNSK